MGQLPCCFAFIWKRLAVCWLEQLSSFFTTTLLKRHALGKTHIEWLMAIIPILIMQKNLSMINNPIPRIGYSVVQYLSPTNRSHVRILNRRPKEVHQVMVSHQMEPLFTNRDLQQQTDRITNQSTERANQCHLQTTLSWLPHGDTRFIETDNKQYQGGN